MANEKREWDKIYKDYKKSGLSRSEFIRKQQFILSTKHYKIILHANNRIS